MNEVERRRLPPGSGVLEKTIQVASFIVEYDLELPQTITEYGVRYQYYLLKISKEFMTEMQSW
jgi:hypothetical protein